MQLLLVVVVVVKTHIGAHSIRVPTRFFSLLSLSLTLVVAVVVVLANPQSCQLHLLVTLAARSEGVKGEPGMG